MTGSGGSTLATDSHSAHSAHRCMGCSVAAIQSRREGWLCLRWIRLTADPSNQLALHLLRIPGVGVLSHDRREHRREQGRCRCRCWPPEAPGSV